jgi:hypothetical protein
MGLMDERNLMITVTVVYISALIWQLFLNAVKDFENWLIIFKNSVRRGPTRNILDPRETKFEPLCTTRSFTGNPSYSVLTMTVLSDFFSV